LLFAGGDISAKLVVLGDAWFLALVPLIAFYALGKDREGRGGYGDRNDLAGASP
jgi:hypothetical protein